MSAQPGPPADAIVARIARDAGVEDLLAILAERMPPTDLQSLLLAVQRQRAARVTPARLLEQYSTDRFVAPSPIDPRLAAELDLLAWSLLPDGWEAIELSPVAPLGTHSAIATVAQDKVLTTTRRNEVVADSTNVLALECALRRRLALDHDPRDASLVKLAASHRVLRMQPFEPPAMQHFRLLGLCTAGRDEGSFRFETGSMVEQIVFHLSLLEGARALGIAIAGMRLTVTDLAGGVRERLLDAEVLAPVAARFPDVQIGFDRDRTAGVGYYRDAGFQVFVIDRGGVERMLVDGGFTSFTAQLLSNAKERLLASGLGTERLCALRE